MKFPALVVVLALTTGVFFGCNSVEKEKVSKSVSSLPAASEESVRDTLSHVEWQIVREDGFPVKMSESAQSAKACSDEVVKGIENMVKRLKLHQSEVAESKLTFDRNKRQKIKDEQANLEDEMAQQKVRELMLCQLAEMGMLTVGTRIFVFEMPEQCGPTMTKVRVLMGNNIDKVGCVSTENVEQIPVRSP